jgi:hypothetical protein
MSKDDGNTSCSILTTTDNEKIKKIVLNDGTTIENIINELALVAKGTGQNGGAWEDWIPQTITNLIPSSRTLKVSACKITAIATFTTIFYVYLQNFGAAIVVKKTITFSFSSIQYILSFAFGNATSYAMGAMIVMLLTYLKYSDNKTRLKIGYLLMNNCYKYVKFCASIVIKVINKILEIEEVQTKLKELYGTTYHVGIPYIVAHFNKNVITSLAHYFCEFYYRENPEPDNKEEVITQKLEDMSNLTSIEEDNIDNIIDHEIKNSEEKYISEEKSATEKSGGSYKKKKSYKKKRKSNRRRKTNRRFR